MDVSLCHNDPLRRHDFVLLFDVTDGNPNGDPDASNMPRVDPETMQGLVTDVCLKRKIRNYVSLNQAGRSGYDIYVNDRGISLNALHLQAYAEQPAIQSTGSKQRRGDVETVRERMCRRFYDVRMFGAVMTTGVNAGQVRGPLQLTFGRSVSPITPLDVTISRVAITRVEDAEALEPAEDRATDNGQRKGKRTELGRKFVVPYGLYVAHGFFSAAFARQTGVTRPDLEVLWQALMEMWDFDRAASRGLMACQGLHVFTHRDALGNAPAQILLRTVQVSLKEGVVAPRSFQDYNVSFDHELPHGITRSSLVGG